MIFFFCSSELLAFLGVGCGTRLTHNLVTIPPKSSIRTKPAELKWGAIRVGRTDKFSLGVKDLIIFLRSLRLEKIISDFLENWCNPYKISILTQINTVFSNSVN
jgi:hypothetical protein